MPAVGDRRHRVTIVQPSETITRGEPVVTWSDVATRWASVEPLAGRELWNARQVQPDVTHRVTLRYESGMAINTKWRLRLASGRILDIVSVTRPEERPIDWVLDCKEAV